MKALLMATAILGATSVAMAGGFKAPAEEARAPGCFSVVDSRNTVVGTVTDFLPQAEMIMVVQGRLIPLYTGPLLQDFQGTGSSSVLFESPDCTGTGYVGPTGGFLPGTAVAGANYQLWVSQDGAAGRDLSIQSERRPGDDACFALVSAGFGLPAQPVLSLGSQFKEPFSISTTRCQ